jgi:hypothetical protein
MVATTLAVLALLVSADVALAGYPASEATHALCMYKFQDGPATELHDRFRPLARNDKEWQSVVDIVLETWHVACFSIFDVFDNRELSEQMPWESPGMICEP